MPPKWSFLLLISLTFLSILFSALLEHRWFSFDDHLHPLQPNGTEARIEWEGVTERTKGDTPDLGGRNEQGRGRTGAESVVRLGGESPRTGREEEEGESVRSRDKEARGGEDREPVRSRNKEVGDRESVRLRDKEARGREDGESVQLRDGESVRPRLDEARGREDGESVWPNGSMTGGGGGDEVDGKPVRSKKEIMMDKPEDAALRNAEKKKQRLRAEMQTNHLKEIAAEVMKKPKISETEKSAQPAWNKLTTVRKMADGCRHVYLDVGTNIGVQIRKMFEQDKFEIRKGYRNRVYSYYDAYLGSNLTQRRRNTCAFGFEPNPNHVKRLKALETCYNERKHWKTHIFTPVAASTTNSASMTFYVSAHDLQYNQWMASLHPDPRVANWTEIKVPTMSLADFVINHVKDRYIPEPLDEQEASLQPSVLMKLDVEGEEYNILPQFITTGAFCEVDLTMLDLHITTPENAKEIAVVRQFYKLPAHKSKCKRQTKLLDYDDETWYNDYGYPSVCRDLFENLPVLQKNGEAVQVDLNELKATTEEEAGKKQDEPVYLNDVLKNEVRAV